MTNLTTANEGSVSSWILKLHVCVEWEESTLEHNCSVPAAATALSPTDAVQDEDGGSTAAGSSSLTWGAVQRSPFEPGCGQTAGAGGDAARHRRRALPLHGRAADRPG